MKICAADLRGYLVCGEIFQMRGILLMVPSGISCARISLLSTPPESIMRSDKQVKINRSCIECRRRKVRCDGQQPCSNCVWYVVADNCQYQPRRRRNCSSNKYGTTHSLHSSVLAPSLSTNSRINLLMQGRETDRCWHNWPERP